MTNHLKQFAIIDIEGSGGKFAQAKITEIAIFISDGEKILDKFSSLINPQRKIDPYVKTLTGITDEMVASQPTFAELAPKIYDLLKDRIIVAHNIDYDLAILKSEFFKLNYNITNQSICTVNALQRLYPGHASYGLSNICFDFGIELKQAHRATDDAYATFFLLKKILSEAPLEYLNEEVHTELTNIVFPSEWTVKGDTSLPNGSGIIYFYDEKDQLIFINHSNNIYKYFLNFFDKANKKDPLYAAVFDATKGVSWQMIFPELKANMLSLVEMNMHRCKFNKAFKNIPAHYYLYLKEDSSGFYEYKIEMMEGPIDIDSPFITCSSFKNADRIKRHMMYSMDLKPLMAKKSRMTKTDSAQKNQLKEELNKAMLASFSEYCFIKKNGLLMLNKNDKGEVEGLKIKNHYIESWVKGNLDNYEEVDFSHFEEDFKIPSNPKYTRYFQNKNRKNHIKIWIEEKNSVPS
jgi:DNA polymerase III epsilon subunit family exonuclease